MSLALFDGGGVLWPPQLSEMRTANAPSSSTFFTFDSASDGFGMVFKSNQAFNLRKIVFRTGTVTGASASMVASIETVDASGNPSGTLWSANGTGANPNATFTIVTASWNLVTLTNDAIIAAGDVFAIVVRNPASSFTTSGAINGYANFQSMGFPYGASINTTPTWTKGSTAYPMMTFEDSNGAYLNMPGVMYMGQPSTTAYNSASGSNRLGAYYSSLPFPCRIDGVWAYISNAAASDFSVKLYSAASSSDVNVLATTGTIDGDHFGGSPSGRFIPFSATYDAARSTPYRLALVPETANNVTAYYVDTNNNAMLGAMPGRGTIYGTSWNGSAWTELNTRRYFMGLSLSALDDGLSSGPIGQARMATNIGTY